MSVPIKKIHFVFCDKNGCRSRAEVKSLRVNDLPKTWRLVTIAGWGGVFHACSEECENMIIAEKERV